MSATPYTPSAELARLHIRSALALVLTQSPRQGKAALESLRTVVLSPYFPGDVADAVERLRSSELGSARPALLNGFIDDLIFGWPDPSHPYYQKPPALVAVEAAVELNRAGTLPRVQANMNKLLLGADKLGVRLGVAIALRVPDAGEAASEPARVVFRAWLKDTDSPFRGNGICRAVTLSWASASALEAAATLTIKELAMVSRTDIPAFVVQRAVDLFSSASSWDEANSIADKAAIPFAPKMDANQVGQIIASAASGQSDLLSSGGFKRFLRAIAHENPLGTPGINAMLESQGLEHHLLPTDQTPET